MSKHVFVRGAISALLASVGSLALAQTTPEGECEDTSVVFGFFNGVQTTREQAEQALREIKRIYKTTSPKGESIEYELFYNHSKGLSDFVETFEQRLTEQNGLLAGRFELFWGNASQTSGHLAV